VLAWLLAGPTACLVCPFAGCFEVGLLRSCDPPCSQAWGMACSFWRIARDRRVNLLPYHGVELESDVPPIGYCFVGFLVGAVWLVSMR